MPEGQLLKFDLGTEDCLLHLPRFFSWYSCISHTIPMSFLCFLYHYYCLLYRSFSSGLIVVPDTLWKRYIMRKYLERFADITVLLRNDQIFALFDRCTKGGKGDIPEGIRGLISIFSPCPLLVTSACFLPMSLLLPASASLCKPFRLGQGLVCLDININNFSSLQRMMYILCEELFKS